MSTTTTVRTTRYRWWHLPAFSLLLGVLCAVAIWIGGDRNDAFGAFGVMAALALVIAVGGRNEMIRGLRGTVGMSTGNA